MREGLALWLVILTGLIATSGLSSARPNVVLFLVDDLGWMDLGCQGSDYYQTANIDALAESGVRFTDAYAACAVCSPTRAAILTGKYPARLLLTQWLPAGRWSPENNRFREGRFLRSLPLEEFTISERLREQGYATWHLGKWHLGGEPFSLPQHHGFDVNIGGDDHGAPGSYFYPFKGSWKVPTTGLAIKKQAYAGGNKGDYLTDCLTDEAVGLIQNQESDSPFFMYLSYYAVHTPLQGRPELKQKYQSMLKKDQQGKPDYAAMIESVDQSVGRVVRALEETDRKQDTLIIFTSDNGGFAGATDNSPLRANKGSHYEGGIRVPLIISGAGVKMKPGTTSGVPVNSCDLFPTVLEVTASPADVTDGQSLALLLGGKDSQTLSDRPIFWHYPHYNRHPHSSPVSIIRKGNWKLIEFLESGMTELYDLKKDPGETNDLSQSHPVETTDLLKQLHQWKSSVGADPMTPNSYYVEKN